MKSSIQVLFVIIFCFSIVNSSCAKEKLKGNGNVVKENRDAKSFTEIKIDGVFNVYLSQADKESIVVEADDNLLPYIKTEVNQGIFSVGLQNNISIKNSTKMNIYITIKDINKLRYSGVGKVTCQTVLKLNSFSLINSGVGSIELKGNATEVDLKNSGVGSINAIDFVVEKLSVKNSGVGSVKVHATKELSIHSSGVGSVSYKGDPAVKNINNSGVGSIRKL